MCLLPFAFLDEFSLIGDWPDDLPQTQPHGGSPTNQTFLSAKKISLEDITIGEYSKLFEKARERFSNHKWIFMWGIFDLRISQIDV